jgi:hypothetical protein
MRRPFVLYDFATAPFWMPYALYMRKIVFSFLSVYCILHELHCMHRTQILTWNRFQGIYPPITLSGTFCTFSA